MSKFFFAFEPFDLEIEKKLATLSVGSGPLCAEYLAIVEKSAVASADVSRVEKLCERLLGLGGSTEYAEYLTHPIRVSASYLPYLSHPTFDDLALSLCHNAIETDWYDAIQEQFLSPGVRGQIKLLTIDRTLERNREYLDRYYNDIEAAPGKLMVLKTLDKLDNALWWAQFDVTRHDSDVIFEYVCPRAARIDRRLADYLEGLARHVLKPETKKRYANDRRGIAAMNPQH